MLDRKFVMRTVFLTAQSFPSRGWRLFCVSIILGLFMTGCATTGNIDPKYDVSVKRETGLVLFSVTHDDYRGPFGSLARDLSFRIKMLDRNSNTELPFAFSNDSGNRFATSPFEPTWGNYFVREYPAGRYAFIGWQLLQIIPYGSRTFEPKVAPVPLDFEVLPGGVVYLGNLHGELVMGKNWLGAQQVFGVVPQIRNESERDLALILKQYPQLAGKVEVRTFPVEPWGPR